MYTQISLHAYTLGNLLCFKFTIEKGLYYVKDKF